MCEGVLSRSSSKDPNSSRESGTVLFCAHHGRVSTLSWYKSEEHTKHKNPVDKWLIVSCEAKFTDEASIPGEPIRPVAAGHPISAFHALPGEPGGWTTAAVRGS